VELVFVNSHFERGYRNWQIAQGSTGDEFGEAMLEEPVARSQKPEAMTGEVVRKHLGKYAKISEHPFAAIIRDFWGKVRWCMWGRGRFASDRSIFCF